VEKNIAALAPPVARILSPVSRNAPPGERVAMVLVAASEPPAPRSELAAA